MDGTADDRLVALEIRYTHLERQHEELNDVVVGQQRLIDDLTKRLAAIVARVSDWGESPTNDRPPHY